MGNEKVQDTRDGNNAERDDDKRPTADREAGDAEAERKWRIQDQEIKEEHVRSK